MPLVIIDKGKEGLQAERISPEQWRKLTTLMVWEKQNPKVWERIKTFVYRRNLHKHDVKLKPRAKKRWRW